MRGWQLAVAGCLLGLGACSGKNADGGGVPEPDGGVVINETPPITSPATPDAGVPEPTPPVKLTPPFTKDGWTFYGAGQGLSSDVRDVSADEGGNVYVAGAAALYVKRKGDAGFLRFDASNAGITKNCYDTGFDPDPMQGASFHAFAATIDASHPTPPGPAIMCPVISVAGLADGAAAIGFQGLGTDNDYDAGWATDSGGMDVVKFDAVAGKLTRTRHVFFGTPPHFVCGVTGEAVGATSCPDVTEPNWAGGRRKLRTVFRIVANHDPASPMYGDIWAGGTHATFAGLLNNAAARGWHDVTAGQTDPKWADAKDVWEHDHPGILSPDGNNFLTGYTFAMSINPRNGMVWASNGVRTAFLQGYGPNLSDRNWFSAPTNVPGHPWYDLWPDSGDFLNGPTNDNVMSMSHCLDGSLWIGSINHGLARIDSGGGVTGFGFPDGNDSVRAVACDPTDGSLWIGRGAGGVMRLKDGKFTTIDPTGLPEVAKQAVASIQIDHFTTPRTVYFAFAPSGGAGKITAAGAVAAYDGP
jgi:hypothetical protein